MKDCQALNRGIIPNECKKAQRELPAKFCEGCGWFESKYLQRRKFIRGQDKPFFKYKIEVAGYMRKWLLKKSAKQGLSVSQFINLSLRQCYEKEI